MVLVQELEKVLVTEQVLDWVTEQALDQDLVLVQGGVQVPDQGKVPGMGQVLATVRAPETALVQDSVLEQGQEMADDNQS
jgi:hypothetical protein